MNNKEYRENQKIQRKSFKKYRKCMWKVLIYFFLAVGSVTVLPHILAPLHEPLSRLFSTLIANSIHVGAQLLVLFGGVLGGVVNAIKANKARWEIDNAQDEEENIVDSLINENEELLKKVDNLEKQKEKVNVEIKTNSKANDFVKNNHEYVEEEKVKKYTK